MTASQNTETTVPNLLLNSKLNALPAFESVTIEQMEPAIDQILADNRQAIAALVSNNSGSWNDYLALEVLLNRLKKAWALISHLSGVKNSNELRPVYNSCQEKISAFLTELGQNEGLYKLYTAIKEKQYESLDATQRRIIDGALLDCKLSGIALEGINRTRFGEIKQRLAKLEAQFDENVMDATQAFGLEIAESEKAKLAGVPDSSVANFQQKAKSKGKQGYLIGIDGPSFLAIMTHCDDRELRAQIYKAFQTRATDQVAETSKFDNTPLMVEILTLKQELALLLGFNNFSELSLAKKMAKDTTAVLTFLEDLAARAKPIAVNDLEELTVWAKAKYPEHFQQGAGLLPWDTGYYANKLKEERYQISEQTIKEYFPVDKVLPGLFAVAERLYGITIKERSGAGSERVEVWHPDVKFYDIFNGSELIAGFYLDLYARDNKRGGAWMDECVCRMQTAEGLQLPIAYLNCNSEPAVGDDSALLTHSNVVTLFHEFGHGLHHMLTKVDYLTVSGINEVPWDAVELPSQFMEFFCWEEEGLKLISTHYKSGEGLSEELLQNMLAAKNYNAGIQAVRQIEFALFDFRLHMVTDKVDGDDIQAVLDQVRSEVAVMLPPEFVRFQNAFTHIFGGGYAAGYYSYKWAEVLAADAFSKFAETGIFNRTTGNEFLHNILAVGGSRDMMEQFALFRGREPSIDALLHYTGLSQ
jgi:oligopeptidase A